MTSLASKSERLVPSTASHVPRASGVDVIGPHATPSLSRSFNILLPNPSPLSPTNKSKITQYSQVGRNPFVAPDSGSSYLLHR